MRLRDRFLALNGASALALLVALGGTAVAQQAPQGPPPTAQPARQVPPLPAGWRPITADYLKSPPASDWPMFRRTYDGWGYSPLDQINAGNVKGLRPVWSFATGQVEGHQAPPQVYHGLMFVATPGNQLLALDAKTGKLIWRFKRPIPEDILLLHPTSRGVAVLGDKVYFAAADAVLVALDVKTGKPVWETKVEDYTGGYYMSLAPLVANGVVMVGTSGGELGIRGFVGGYDAETGKELWKAYAVPEPGKPGSETWPANDAWKTGGGSVWVTGTYDPETNLAFWGTGNGGPWMGDQRPGDNLFTTAVMAIDVTSGAIKGHFQYHPNDSWDWDEVSPPIVVDYERNGRTVKGLVNVARNGYLWWLERTADKINFVEGKPYVYQNVFKSLDPKTGRPEIDEARKPGTGKRAEFCPSLWGGKDWPPVAYSPKTKLMYIPANDNLCGSIEGQKIEYKRGQRFTGAVSTMFFRDANDPHIGELQAWDLSKGERVWTTKFPNTQNWGPVLATGGDLLFMGGTNDRKFRAFDAKNGAVLWEFPMPSGVTGTPSSFSVDGKQYVAVVAGWGVDAARMQNRLNILKPGQFDTDIPQGGSIWVFAVD